MRHLHLEPAESKELLLPVEQQSLLKHKNKAFKKTEGTSGVA